MDTNKLETKLETKQYIVVNIGEEQYGIDISYVDNIVKMQKITRVPKSQKYFNGVINLRGDIVPIMSLRRRFELEEDVFTDKTRIIILKPEQQEPIGIIVDMVKEVVNLSEQDVDKMAIDAQDELSKYICGIGKNNNNNTLISLLNINNVIAENQ
ncbi:MAG: chemotaxis protein CheW [Lachnospiraceae bacterium]|nr:chemotaxis protein CheW [Clostridiales bacterium]MDD6294215.1 chemotaxis protein CheW [Eubacteriales bacterium]MDY2607218.1 chemotaxis protein CheW [Lachnospiraceae bacterium]